MSDPGMNVLVNLNVKNISKSISIDEVEICRVNLHQNGKTEQTVISIDIGCEWANGKDWECLSIQQTNELVAALKVALDQAQVMG